jgi:sugar phosphate isomerase/epimerase
VAAKAKEKRVRAEIGIQLYSVRNEIQKDVTGTLARVKALGVEHVEVSGFAGLSVDDFAAALRRAKLSCRAAHFPYERFRDDAAGVMKDLRTLGGTYAVCAWIPHEGPVTRADIEAAAAVFNRAGKAAKAESLRFAYHIHGYEFARDGEGTLFDTLVADTPADLVGFEIDTYWAVAGGVDPAKLIETLAGRVPLTHLKDMQRGLEFTPPTDRLPVTTNVVLGTGSLDFPAILKASDRAGVEIHFLEDEHPEALEHLPRSLKYIRDLARS